MGENILIEVKALGERKSEGGIIIPESSSEFIREGIVVALGEGIKGLSIGDHVVIHSHTGIPMDMKKDGLVDQSLWMLSANEILAKIDAE